MAYLGNPSGTIEVLQKYNFNFQKKFGQNFLIDPHVLDKIIRAAEVTKEDCVLEIGPGIGTMTQYLAEHALEGLKDMKKLDEWFPELESLIGVEQSPVYHTEGDVWNHTMMVIDEAAKMRDKVTYPLGFMLCALAHDFGKAVSTQVIGGKIHAYAHEVKGLPLIDVFLKRITKETKLKRYVMNLCEYHMKPNALAENNASVKSTNKMFDSVCAPEDLIYLSAADNLGRISEKNNSDNTPFLFERLRTYKSIMAKPCVLGKDLIEAGLTPDKNFSEILSYAHKLHLAGIEKESALKQTLSYARKIKR